MAADTGTRRRRRASAVCPAAPVRRLMAGLAGKRGHLGERLDVAADRYPRDPRARIAFIGRGHEAGIIERAHLDDDVAGPQLQLVEDAGTADRTKTSRDASPGLGFRPVGAQLPARDRETCPRHRHAGVEDAAAGPLAIPAMADELPSGNAGRFVANRAAQTSTPEIHADLHQSFPAHRPE